MFILTLLGTILAALLALCGLINVVMFFVNAQQGTPIGLFINGFVVAAAPLVAACVLQLLIELLKEVTALREAQETPQVPAPAAPATPKPEVQVKPAEPAKPAEPLFFPVRDTPQGPVVESPTPIAPPAPEAEKRPQFFRVD